MTASSDRPFDDEHRIEVGGTSLHVATAGYDGGDDRPAVLLLHGWPDTHALWRHQVTPLVDAGFRVVAPDLKGFGRSDAPVEVEHYAIPVLVGEVLGVLDHLGVEEAHVVGHDWGAALSWVLATLAPDRAHSLTALSVGHPTAFIDAGMPQREKSWYMLLWQTPGVAEQWLTEDGGARMREWGHHPEHDDIQARWADHPDRVTASLGFYRANLPPEAYVAPPLELPPVAVPTMGVWSSGDHALVEEQMTGSAAHVAGSWRYERLDDAGHWLTLDAPDRVSALLVDFLSSVEGARSAG